MSRPCVDLNLSAGQAQNVRCTSKLLPGVAGLDGLPARGEAEPFRDRAYDDLGHGFRFLAGGSGCGGGVGCSSSAVASSMRAAR
jgi:hypothetical protein